MDESIFPLIGYTDDEAYTLYGDDFTFVLTDARGKNRHESRVKPVDGFIYGHTFSGHDVALYCDQQMATYGYGRLNTYLFFMAQEGLFSGDSTVCFSKIVFMGGTLNNLFWPNGVDLETEEKGLNLTYTSDDLIYDFDCEGEKGKIKIGSALNWSRGVNGTVVDNTRVRFTIEFDEPKPMSHLIKCYDTLLVCMRFMTNRHNVGIDGILCFSQNGTENDMPQICNAYIKKDEDFTQKETLRCMTFEDLKETVVSLWEMIYTSNEKKRKYSLGFFPENDKRFAQERVTNDMIRSVCSALEFEAENEPLVQPDSNAELAELITSVKQYVKDYRKKHGSGHISNSTYDRIFTGIDFWSFSAKDKIMKLYEIHKKAVDNANRGLLNQFEVNIPAFVKYRNSITHGAESQPTIDVAVTAVILRSLVYCCILKRIGLAEDKIIQLADLKINT